MLILILRMLKQCSAYFGGNEAPMSSAVMTKASGISERASKEAKSSKVQEDRSTNITLITQTVLPVKDQKKFGSWKANIGLGT